jgi:hypothetical protein
MRRRKLFRFTTFGKSRVGCGMNVAYWPIADIPTVAMNVRFHGNSGHRSDDPKCLLLIHFDVQSV